MSGLSLTALHTAAGEDILSYSIPSPPYLPPARDKYIGWLQKWIGVDIFGKCGDKQCGEVKNIGHEYSTDEDPCFHMVNRKYRSVISIYYKQALVRINESIIIKIISRVSGLFSSLCAKFDD